LDRPERDYYGPHGRENVDICAPWKLDGELADMTGGQRTPGGRPIESWQSYYEDKDKCVDEQRNGKFQLKRLSP